MPNFDCCVCGVALAEDGQLCETCDAELEVSKPKTTREEEQHETAPPAFLVDESTRHCAQFQQEKEDDQAALEAEYKAWLNDGDGRKDLIEEQTNPSSLSEDKEENEGAQKERFGCGTTIFVLSSGQRDDAEDGEVDGEEEDECLEVHKGPWTDEQAPNVDVIFPDGQDPMEPDIQWILRKPKGASKKKRKSGKRTFLLSLCLSLALRSCNVCCRRRRRASRREEDKFVRPALTRVHIRSSCFQAPPRRPRRRGRDQEMPMPSSGRNDLRETSHSHCRVRSGNEDSPRRTRRKISRLVLGLASSRRLVGRRLRTFYYIPLCRLGLSSQLQCGTLQVPRRRVQTGQLRVPTRQAWRENGDYFSNALGRD